MHLMDIFMAIFLKQKKEFLKLKKDIVEFTLDKHYEDFEGFTDYDCSLKVAFQENREILLRADNNCILSNSHSSGKYKYSKR